MVFKCVLCNNKTSENPKSQISFHSFPANPDIREKWIKITGIEDNLIKPSLKICSVHFSEDSYIPLFSKSKGLKRTAVPSLSINKSVLNTTKRRNAAILISPKLPNKIPTIMSHDKSPINNLSTSSSNTMLQSTIGFESLSNCAPMEKKEMYSHHWYTGDCTEEHFSTSKERKNNLIFYKKKYLLQ